MSQLTIRRAKPGDEAALSEVGRATFTQTFAHLYPPEDLADFLNTTHDRAAIAKDLADPAMALWLVEKDFAPVGYALAGPCNLPHPGVTHNCGELKRIYLLAPAQGQGTGGRLLQMTLDWLQGGGPRTLWIGVYSQNLGAQRLYARHGFERVGEYQFHVGQTRDHEFILRRLPLGDA